MLYKTWEGCNLLCYGKEHNKWAAREVCLWCVKLDIVLDSLRVLQSDSSSQLSELPHPSDKKSHSEHLPSLVPRPHLAHVRRSLVSQVKILGLAPEVWNGQSDHTTAFIRIIVNTEARTSTCTSIIRLKVTLWYSFFTNYKASVLLQGQGDLDL